MSTFTIGSGAAAVTLYPEDMPDGLPLAQEATGSDIALGDGTLYPRVSGMSLLPIQIKGTIATHRGGTPLQKMHRLLALQAIGRPVAVVWQGDGMGESFLAVIRRFEPTVVRAGEVEYVLTLARSVTGALLTLTPGGLDVVTPAGAVRRALAASATAPAATKQAAAALGPQTPPVGF